jgi:tRNA-binding EMAP/Myf-like protein
MLGKHVVAALNLAPRKMMGIESHGMLLAAHSDDQLHLVVCTADAGSEVG